MGSDNTAESEGAIADCLADRVLASVADAVQRLSCPFVRRVGIDGVDGAGKTQYADRLAKLLRARGEKVIRASVDGFHHPRVVRYRSGRFCPQGFYRDSYDYAAFRRLLLDPLSPGGSGEYVTAAFDHRLDSRLALPSAQAAAGAILLVDGVFLHRPELAEYWDLSVLLHIDPAVSVARLVERDRLPTDPLAPIHQRYAGGQKLYFAECKPAEQAAIVLDNTHPSQPRALAWRVPHGAFACRCGSPEGTCAGSPAPK